MPRIQLFFAMLIGALTLSAPALAQSCDNYRVDARLLNMRAEPNVFGTILDVLRQNELVCISRSQNTTGQDWGYVVSKSRPDGTGTQTVEGWTSLRYLSRVETPSAPTPPSTADGGSSGPTPVSEPVDLNFTDPVPFGPFPVRGRSLEQLANSLPLFSPIDGLPEDRWKQKCVTCHQWNKDRLCDQGKSYAGNPVNIIRIKHPYGGPYKKALATWSESGCQ